jgi:hypothetical protein
LKALEFEDCCELRRSIELASEKVTEGWRCRIMRNFLLVPVAEDT